MLGALLVAAVLAVPVVLLLEPSLTRSLGAANAEPQSVAGIASSLVSGPLVAETPSTFWGEVVQTKCSMCIATDPSVGAFLNASPFTWVRYGQGDDYCNLTANRGYDDNGAVTGGCGFNIGALKRWCDSTTPHCHAILALPGENNNSAEDGAIARYIVRTEGFQPDYWAIGNEPTGWTHYGKPWTQWTTLDRSKPTPVAYAVDVRNAIAAVLGVDPSAKFIGVQAACSCNGAWFTDVAKIDGSSVAAYGYHSYPAGSKLTTETLAQLYAPLAGPSNLSGSYPAVRAAIAAGCARCAARPIFVDEYNAGPGWSPSNWGGTYANAVFLAASTVQALRENVSQFAPFDLQTYSTTRFGYSMMNGHDAIAPTGVLFTQLLSHLATGHVYAANVRTTVPGVWSVLTSDATSETLLVVNTNLTHAIALGLGTVFASGLNAVTYRWAPGVTAPTSTSGTLASIYSVPSQGILLLRLPLMFSAHASASGSSGSAPFQVHFSESVHGGSAPYSYAWTFGDGGTSTAVSPYHTYTLRGTYTAALRVTDSQGTRASSTVSLHVGASLSVTIATSTLLGVGPLCITFTATPAGGTSPYRGVWHFGDGSRAGQGLSLRHCYRGLGVYRAQANVTDAAAHAVGVKVGPITVLPLLPAPVGIAPNAAILGGAFGSVAGSLPPALIGGSSRALFPLGPKGSG